MPRRAARSRSIVRVGVAPPVCWSVATSRSSGNVFSLSKTFDKLKTLPELRDVATDQQTGGATPTLTIDRDRAARLGIPPQLIDGTPYHAFGQRPVTPDFTQLHT